MSLTDPLKYFLVYMDASKEGLGKALMQEGHVIFYESRKLNEHEINYVTHEFELTTIFHALKMWRQYLVGRKFVLMLNHGGMKYLFDSLN